MVPSTSPNPDKVTLIQLTTLIDAPIERCFDLSRSIDLHLLSTHKTEEKAVAGVTSGLINKGESVTWEAVHFGIRQRLTTEIIEMDKPHIFIDVMVNGAFKSMHHEHWFEATDDGTLMCDTFYYEVPYGIVGRLFDNLLLKAHMTRLLTERNEVIKKAAEGDLWKSLLTK